jgi:putative flavoprotein involved in K+ transport
MTDVVVIGAGPAGLAVAATLSRRGVRAQLLERGDSVGTSWRRRYDGLRLNTVRWLCDLPGYRMPARMGRWVSRDDYVDYLDRYASHHRLRITTRVDVASVQRGTPAGAPWTLRTSKGDLTAAAVVIASGAFDRPVLPEWPGLSDYRGVLAHAAAYRDPRPYRGAHVLVVGAGASGLEIALLLAAAGAARVDLSVRSCTNLFTRQWGPFPLTPLPPARHLPAGALDLAGRAIHRLLGSDWPRPLPAAPAGLGTALRRDGTEPVVADGIVAALRAGTVNLVAAVQRFGETDVRLADGTSVRPDAVLAATGYRSGLAELAGELGVLRPGVDRPQRGDGGPCPDAAGLAFVGFEPAVTGRLPQLPAQASRAARTVLAGLGR